MLSGNPLRTHRKSPALVLVLVLAVLSLVGSSLSPAVGGKKKKNVLSRPVPVDAMPSAPMTLSRANEEWAQAASQTRIPLPIKKGRDKQGWSKSEWLRASGEKHKMRVWINDREDLLDIIPRDSLLVGVNLVCERWFVQNPKKGRGVTAEFRFANYPGTLRLEFQAGVEEIDEIERFLRFNVVTVQRLSDRIDAPATARTPASRRPSHTAPPPGIPPSAKGNPAAAAVSGVRVISAEARPAIVAAGDEIELLIAYEINDPTGDEHTVVERRTLLRDDVEITYFEDNIVRVNGTFTSSQKVRIPADARTGRYGFRARVGVGDSSDERSATFEVR